VPGEAAKVPSDIDEAQGLLDRLRLCYWMTCTTSSKRFDGGAGQAFELVSGAANIGEI
jgi:hypothetical protein